MRKNLTLGVIIILIGIIWLLSNLNIFSFSVVDVFFRSLAKLWPLILIGFGLNILLKDNAVSKLLVWLIIFLTIFLYGLFGINSGVREYRYSPPNYNYSENHDYSISKEAATQEGRLNFNFAAGEVRLGAVDTDLLQLESNIPDLKCNHSFQDDNKRAVIDFDKTNHLSIRGKNDNLFCYLNLHQEVIWDLDLDLGAAKAQLDLTNLAVKKLELDVGAADLDLRLGTKHSQTDIAINSGASNLKIYVPKEAGLKIYLDSALSSNNIAGLGLEKQGDYHISPGFDENPVQLVFDIDTGVGNVNFQTV